MSKAFPRLRNIFKMSRDAEGGSIPNVTLGCHIRLDLLTIVLIFKKKNAWAEMLIEHAAVIECHSTKHRNNKPRRK